MSTKRTKKDGVTIRDSIGRNQTPTLINEKLPRAKEFKHWVTYEVLPAIRKTGSYTFNKSVEIAPMPAKKVRRPLSPTACVYALLHSDGTVKIGHTGNLRERVAKIEYKTGLKVTDIYYALTISREATRLIEWV